MLRYSGSVGLRSYGLIAGWTAVTDHAMRSPTLAAIEESDGRPTTSL